MSDVLFLEAVVLAVPSATDWSSLSLLLAGREKTAVVKDKERKKKGHGTGKLSFPI